METTPINTLINFIQENNPTNEQIVGKLKEMKLSEENIINRAYLIGFHDKETGKKQNTNYYRYNYGPSYFTSMLKK